MLGTLDRGGRIDKRAALSRRHSLVRLVDLVIALHPGLVSAGVLLVAGCSGSSFGAPPDDAGTIALPDAAGADAGSGADRDSDNDRVCDSTEEREGTNTALADSDRDGYSDWVEIVFNFDPLRPSEPDRDTVFVLRETESAALQVPIQVSVRGEGQTYSGALEAEDAVDYLGLTALDHFDEAVGLFAEPMEQVGMIDGEDFHQVTQRTLLGWELRFSFGTNIPRLCARLYPFVYRVKRDDGAVVAAPRRYLLVLPEGGTLDTEEWCPGDGFECI